MISMNYIHRNCKLGTIRQGTSVAEPEPPLSRSRFFCWPEPGDGAAFLKAAPALAASFRQAKKKRLVLVSNMTLRAV